MSNNSVPASFFDAKWRKDIVGAHGTALLFKDLPHKNLLTLLENATVKEYKTGEILIQQGDIPSNIYMVLEGTVKTNKYSEEGEEAIIQMLKTGDTFMEANVFMGGASSVNAQVVDEAKLLLIPESSVKTHILISSQFARNLLEVISKHYKDAVQQTSSIILKSPVQRIGAYLLQLHLESGSNTTDMVLPFKKSMIAHHLGMQPETFSRALQRIKKSGIDIDGEKITLLDSFSLCHFCDPDLSQLCNRCDEKGCTFHDEDKASLNHASKE